MGRPAGDEQVPDLRTSGPMSSSDEQVRSCTLSPDSFTIPRPLPYSKVYGFGKNNDDSSEPAELLHSGGGPDVGLRVPILVALSLAPRGAGQPDQAHVRIQQAVTTPRPARGPAAGAGG
jgi:hypothetical protein